jgi:hypothetical protein
VTRVTRDPSRSRVAVLDYCPSSTGPDAASAQLHAAGREHVWTTRQSPDLDVDTQPVASAATATEPARLAEPHEMAAIDRKLARMKDRELQPRPTWLCVTRHDGRGWRGSRERPAVLGGQLNRDHQRGTGRPAGRRATARRG